MNDLTKFDTVAERLREYSKDWRDRAASNEIVLEGADTIDELLEALAQAVDTLDSLRSELEPPLTQVVRGRAAIAKARGAA